MNQPAKVIFYRVRSNQAKVQLICSKAQEAFAHEKRLLIIVPTEEAGSYIDSLLWRNPEESFLPHLFTRSSTLEWIAITTVETINLNQADNLLNLCLHMNPLHHQFKEIYELYDETHASKLECSQKRLKGYQDQGLYVKEC